MIKKEKQEIVSKCQEIADEYHISLIKMIRIVFAAIYSDNCNTFRIPEQYKKKHELPEYMVQFIYSVVDERDWRPCELRDLCLEQFPDCGIDKMKIYFAVYHIIYREDRLSYNRDYYAANKERAKLYGIERNKRRKAIYKEVKETKK